MWSKTRFIRVVSLILVTCLLVGCSKRVVLYSSDESESVQSHFKRGDKVEILLKNGESLELTITNLGDSSLSGVKKAQKRRYSSDKPSKVAPLTVAYSDIAKVTIKETNNKLLGTGIGIVVFGAAMGVVFWYLLKKAIDEASWD